MAQYIHGYGTEDSTLDLQRKELGMKPPYAVYVLLIEWIWDHTNPEVATLTIEGRPGERYEDEFELLVDPACPESTKQHLLGQLQRLGDTLNRSSYPDVFKLHSLYRVSDYGGIMVHLLRMEELQAGAVPELHMKLEPICGFDEKGNPVPISKAEPQAV